MTDQALSPDLRSAQLAAIDASGWGRTFRIFQAHNLTSWVFLLYLVGGALAAFRWFRPGFEALSVATLGGTIVFALYALPWVWYLRHIDRWSQLPAKIIVWGFLWGGLTATFFIAMPANEALLSIYNKVVSASFAQDWGPALAAPFSEETGKGVGIMLLMFIAPQIIRSPFDGFVLGAWVGLGFQIFEDILYVINQAQSGFGDNQVGAVIQIFFLRAVAGIVAHALFSAIYGTGLVYLIGTPVTPARRARGLGLILTAMIFHATWDGMSAIAGEIGINVFLSMLLFGVFEVAVLLAIQRRAAGTERFWLRDILAPEVERGTISAPELAAMSGTRKERKRFLKHATGYKSRKTAQHVLDAAFDLARAIADSRGTETNETRYARAEVARIRGAA